MKVRLMVVVLAFPLLCSGLTLEQVRATRSGRPLQTSLRLIVDGDSVQVGEDVRFSLEPAETWSNSPFIFTFEFGDGT